MNPKISSHQVFQDFYPRICHYIGRIVGPHEVEDIAQEVFEKVHRNLHEFKGKSKLSSWIYRIATNTAIDKLRSAPFKRSAEHEPIIEDSNTADTPTTASTDQKVIRKEMSACVREFIGKLPDDYQAIILLRDIQGFSKKEIAEILEISPNNAKIRLHRARGKLKELLDAGCDFYLNENSELACDRKQPEILPKPPG
jgi:RNA polymerase sigma-70 factor, ECF subfamily